VSSVKFIEIEPERVDLRELFARAVAFHGHPGPFLASGLRMGLLALRELRSPGHGDLEVTVETGTTPPLSCLIDGIQVATGCTLGKGNIYVRDGHRPRATFTAKDGWRLMIELNLELAERFAQGDPGTLAEEALSLSEEELFRWDLQRR